MIWFNFPTINTNPRGQKTQSTGLVSGSPEKITHYYDIRFSVRQLFKTMISFFKVWYPVSGIRHWPDIRKIWYYVHQNPVDKKTFMYTYLCAGFGLAVYIITNALSMHMGRFPPPLKKKSNTFSIWILSYWNIQNLAKLAICHSWYFSLYLCVLKMIFL